LVLILRCVSVLFFRQLVSYCIRFNSYQYCVCIVFFLNSWVNNCVGVGNHKLFLLFVFWVFVTSAYSLLLVLGKYVSCLSRNTKCVSSPSISFHTIALVICSILFGLFTLCMLGDQLSAISSSQTAIDRLKNTKHKYQSEVNEVCGSARHVRCHHTWFIPYAVKFPEGNLRDKILGYRLQRLPGDAENEEFSPLMDGGGDIEMGVRGSVEGKVGNSSSSSGSGSNKKNTPLSSASSAYQEHRTNRDAEEDQHNGDMEEGVPMIAHGGSGKHLNSSPNGGLVLRKKVPPVRIFLFLVVVLSLPCN
jgi:hypothetical protein